MLCNCLCNFCFLLFLFLYSKSERTGKSFSIFLCICWSTIIDIIFLQFTVFPCNFNSPQVKWNLISGIIHFVYELPNELPNDLKEMKRKSQNWVETQPSVQFPLQKLIFGNSSQSRYYSFLACPVLLDFVTFGHRFCQPL